MIDFNYLLLNSIFDNILFYFSCVFIYTKMENIEDPAENLENIDDSKHISENVEHVNCEYGE